MDSIATFRPRGADRRRHRRARFLERRSGFDRRHSRKRSLVAAAVETSLLRLRDDPRMLADLLVFINLLSVVDLVVTFTLLRLGATELNPVMDFMIALDPVAAVAFKVSAVGLATLGLWLLRRYRLALTTSLLLLVAFGALIVYELVGLAHLA